MDELMAEIQVPRDESSLIMVIGVCGAGCNAVSNMWHAGVKGVLSGLQYRPEIFEYQSRQQ